ncbi:MAG: hypothetical protein M3N13_10890 [Candidatus Eremiobacteraeota bacterium]|nr:hypothetical protein [Candidatus Eremiobacteraeota bacterium]
MTPLRFTTVARTPCGRRANFAEVEREMKDSDAFVDLVHLASALVDPKSTQRPEERLRTALPAALSAMANAPLEQIVEFVRSARAAGMRFSGTDEDVALSIKKRANT